MIFLLILIETFLQILSSWTLAYHVSLIVDLPSGLIVIPFLMILMPLLFFYRRNWKCYLSLPKDESWFLISTISLGLTVGILPLFISNPNPDDYNFFHRALVQLQHLDSPFILTDTAHNISGLPPLSIPHILTSYEHFIAMTAALLGAAPLHFYHNASIFVAEILMVVVFVLLYRQLGLTRVQTLAATIFAFFFLFSDIRLTSRSFGNIILYLWTGKVLLWGVLVPITLLVSYRFLCSPTLKRFGLVFMASICAVGLSGSGVFMLPVLILGVSLAYLLSYGFSVKRLKRVVSLNVASSYCVGIGIAIATGLLPMPSETSVWSKAWPQIWWSNLGLVINNIFILIRDLLILSIVPMLGIRRPLNRFPVLLTLALILIFANPVTGPFWVQLVQPGAYWRLIFLFPLPWCAGLIVCGFTKQNIHTNKYPVIMSRTLTVIALLSIITVYHISGMTPKEMRNYIHFKTPLEYRFSPQELAFVQSVSARLQNRNILAPESIAVVLALINPTTRFEAVRGTQHIFANAGQRYEGTRRIIAQKITTVCTRTSETEVSLATSLEMGINAIILKECNPEALSSLITFIRSINNSWTVAERNNGYILMLKFEEN